MTQEPEVADLAAVADELYALGPEEFTSARNARAKGIADRAVARQVKAFAKPALAAWAVNMLARHEAEVLEQVLSLGEALRRAQGNLDAEEMRELDKQRRQLTAAVTAQTRRLAADLGHQVGESVARQVEETLHAAMTDEDAAAAVRSGLLTAPLSSTGLGPVDLSRSVALTPTGAPPTPAEPAAEPDTPPESPRPELTVVPEEDHALEEAEQAAEEATAAAAKAEKKQKKAERRVAKLQARSLQLEAELEEVRRRAGELEYELDAVDEDLSAAQEEQAERERRLADARRAADEARREVERLRQ